MFRLIYIDFRKIFFCNNPCFNFIEKNIIRTSLFIYLAFSFLETLENSRKNHYSRNNQDEIQENRTVLSLFLHFIFFQYLRFSLLRASRQKLIIKS